MAGRVAWLKFRGKQRKTLFRRDVIFTHCLFGGHHVRMKDLIYGFVRSGEYLPAIFLAGLPNNEEGDEMNYSSNEKSSYYVFPLHIDL